MKFFLVISFCLLLVALGVVVVVFWLVNMQLDVNAVTHPQATDLSVSIATTSAEVAAVESGLEMIVPAEGLPLRDLPISATQERVISSVGIDIETFTFTPSMLACGVEKLGAARVAEIVAGDTPSIVETARLVPCLGEKP